MAKVLQLEEHLQRHLPHIHYATPTSSYHGELREAFSIDNTAVPLALARPKTADDVASLVHYAVSTGIEITVRTGGHDLYGRCFARADLALDMGHISFIHVAKDSSSAKLTEGS
jgi:FAD/FMN-containing dehydrogenase